MRESMSVRLVEGGRAMGAGQSCIAGPSVCVTSCCVCYRCGPHLSFSRIGTKKGASRRAAGRALRSCAPVVPILLSRTFAVYSTPAVRGEQAFFLLSAPSTGLFPAHPRLACFHTLENQGLA